MWCFMSVVRLSLFISLSSVYDQCMLLDEYVRMGNCVDGFENVFRVEFGF